jgi:hypothetical protein
VASSAVYFSVSKSVAAFASIGSITLVFVIKQKLMALGIIMIVLGIIIVISTSAFGIFGSVLLVSQVCPHWKLNL